MAVVSPYISAQLTKSHTHIPKPSFPSHSVRFRLRIHRFHPPWTRRDRKCSARAAHLTRGCLIRNGKRVATQRIVSIDCLLTVLWPCSREHRLCARLGEVKARSKPADPI
ncbi:BQ5605_C002g01372 [Microbotryum silenes-dioicae]|uniref:BQ5605_C002g01372 protein n=1 Tax=Microbotryum silenes-dioicae TaxID=796604 RepID=A0A2X0M2D4_9BASI|nr:BQ5605_C002g01372 [Microbotryum silenes-dioicae]